MGFKLGFGGTCGPCCDPCTCESICANDVPDTITVAFPTASTSASQTGTRNSPKTPVNSRGSVVVDHTCDEIESFVMTRNNDPVDFDIDGDDWTDDNAGIPVPHTANTNCTEMPCGTETSCVWTYKTPVMNWTHKLTWNRDFDASSNAIYDAAGTWQVIFKARAVCVPPSSSYIEFTTVMRIVLESVTSDMSVLVAGSLPMRTDTTGTAYNGINLIGILDNVTGELRQIPCLNGDSFDAVIAIPKPGIGTLVSAYHGPDGILDGFNYNNPFLASANNGAGIGPNVIKSFWCAALGKSPFLTDGSPDGVYVPTGGDNCDANYAVVPDWSNNATLDFA